MRHEPSTGAWVAAVLALVLIGAAVALPWLSYDHSTGRQTAPDGPYADDPRVERQELDLYAFGWQGDVEPEAGRAQAVQAGITAGLALAALAALIAVLGEVPRIGQVLHRRVVVIAMAIGMTGLMAALALAWFLLPASMAAYGITGPFTYFLIEPDGYTRSTIALGWVAAALAVPVVFAAGLLKYQAGDPDPAIVEEYRAA